MHLPPHVLTFTFIPDLLVDGAYDEAVRDVETAIHIGGPIAHGDEDLSTLEESIVEPSVRGTMNMLFACEKARNVRRVILTSSIMGLMSWNDYNVEETGRVFTETSRVKEPEGLCKRPYQVGWEAYSNAKIRSLNESEAWVRERKGKLHFDVVNVHPSIVIGQHELARTKEEVIKGVNFIAIMHVMGQVSAYPIAGTTVHIDDVAEGYIRVLDRAKVKTGEDGLLSVLLHSQSPGGSVWDEAKDVVRQAWPEMVQKGLLPCTGTQPTKETLIDAGKTAELLGMEFRGFGEQIRGLFEQWLPYVEKDGVHVGERIV